MNMKRIVLVVVCILITVFAVVGCGGKQSASNDTVVTEDAEVTAVKNTVFQHDKWEEALKLVEDSKLSSEDKQYFKTFIRGYPLNQYSGKTIGELIDMAKEHKKNTQPPPKEKSSSTFSTTVTIDSAYKCDKIFDDPVPKTDGYNARIDYSVKNNSSKTLQAVQIEYAIFDDFQEIIVNEKINSTKLNLSPGQSASFYYKTDVYADSSTGRRIQDVSTTNLKADIKILKAVYTDGTMETSNDIKQNQ